MARQLDEPVEEEAPKGLRENCLAFLRFLWNPNEGTVLGRTARSWGRITVFYLFYYAFLTCLFTISITITYHCLDKSTPYYQTRLENPGVIVQPKLKSKDSLERDIIYSLSDEASYGKYTSQLTDFLEPYNGNQTDDDLWADCDTSLARTDLVFNNEQIATSCRFDPEEKLGACGSGDYGYSEGKPCVLVKLNRVINWLPLGYSDPSVSEEGEFSKAPSLADVLGDRETSNCQLYVSCYGIKEADRENLNGEVAQVSKNTKYNPEGLGFGFYPYFGKVHQPNYLSPLVGVQFTNVTRNVEINVGCKVYAQNIDEMDRLESGYFRFKLQIND